MSEIQTQQKQRFRWTEDAARSLIERVQRIPVLWNPRHPHFRVHQLKREKFQDIALWLREKHPELGDVSFEHVRNKFRSMRTSYLAKKRKMERGSPPKNIRSHKLLEWMSFTDHSSSMDVPRYNQSSTSWRTSSVGLQTDDVMYCVNDGYTIKHEIFPGEVMMLTPESHVPPPYEDLCEKPAAFSQDNQQVVSNFQEALAELCVIHNVPTKTCISSHEGLCEQPLAAYLERNHAVDTFRNPSAEPFLTQNIASTAYLPSSSNVVQRNLCMG